MESVKSTVGLQSHPRIAWIGLGQMGRGMVKNVAEKGKSSGPVVIFNRTAQKAEKVAATMAPGRVKVATSIETVIKEADYIFTCVANDAAIQETIDAALEIPEARGKLFVDCSTVHPDKTNELAKQINAAGAEFVACPVFGAPPMAEAGQLVCVLAGPAAQVDKVRPFCKDVMGRAEINFSDQPQGNATRLKIIGNTMILSMIESLSEAHVLAEKSGLGSDDFHAFIEVMFPGPHTAYSQRLRSGDYYKRDEAAFEARLALKDANHAKALADGCGARMRGLEVVQDHLETVLEYSGTQDLAGVYGVVRRESGLAYEN